MRFCRKLETLFVWFVYGVLDYLCITRLVSVCVGLSRVDELRSRVFVWFVFGVLDYLCITKLVCK